MAIQITDQLITTALGRRGRAATIEIFDATEPGLRLRIGVGAARWSYRIGIVQKSRLRIALGKWPEVDVSEVRRLWSSQGGREAPR